MAHIPYADNLKLSAEVLLQSLQQHVVMNGYRRHPFIGTSEDISELLAGNDPMFGIWARVFRNIVERVGSFASVVPTDAWKNADFRRAAAEKIAATLREPQVIGDALQSLGAHADNQKLQAADDDFKRDLATQFGYGSPEYELNHRRTVDRILGASGAARMQSRSEAMAYQMAWALVETLDPSSWDTQQGLLGAFPDRRREHGIELQGTIDPRQPFTSDSIRLIPQSVLFGVGAIRMGVEMARLQDKEIERLTGGALNKDRLLGLARERAADSTHVHVISYMPDGDTAPMSQADNFDTADIQRALPSGGELPGLQSQ